MGLVISSMLPDMSSTSFIPLQDAGSGQPSISAGCDQSVLLVLPDESVGCSGEQSCARSSKRVADGEAAPMQIHLVEIEFSERPTVHEPVLCEGLRLHRGYIG